MKYEYKLLYETKIKSKFNYIIELPCFSKIQSIMVETNLPKRTILRLVGNGYNVLLEIPIFYLKNLWFPLDIEAEKYDKLTLNLLNNSKVEKYIKVYIAMGEGRC